MVNTKAIKCRMIDYDLTTAELADKIGLTPSYTSAIISGKRALTLSVANKIQEVLEISNDDFGHYFLSGGRNS